MPGAGGGPCLFGLPCNAFSGPEASIEHALKDVRKALQLKKRTYYHLELGKTYLKMGRTELARKHLQATLETAPMSPFAPNHKEKARQLLDEMG